VRALLDHVPVHAMAHVTGGGFLENLPRMFARSGLAAIVDPDAWQRPAVFAWLQQAGNIDEREMLRTFNCGIGFVVCVPAAAAQDALALLAEHGEQATVIGTIATPDTSLQSGQLLIV
jgi:phosphoribosylformylglycinamidine cyclo-ligase